ncbi:MAG: alpha/beta hydrolase [Pseudomonadaceae bacterium]|nr:alpha/beta hydrolase [Pseudomonadaceae bacterium]
MTLLILLLIAAGLWWLTKNRLDGDDLAEFQQPRPTLFRDRPTASPEHKQVFDRLKALRQTAEQAKGGKRLTAMRDMLEAFFGDTDVDATITPVNEPGLVGEWVQAPGTRTDRRLLYIHGGAFTLGSPRSHRGLTSRLSKIADAAVFAVDYRLMPEHPRHAGITDCQRAYQWLTVTGPDSAAPAQTMFVAGDSAGGNLTLMLIAWLRDRGLRAPDAAIALSPATDSTFRSPSMKDNIPTDVMLGSGIGRMMKLPRFLLLWIGLLTNRMLPSNPLLSPALGDLSHLPPLLVQASSAEMLFDDSIRYVNKARAAGSQVDFQVWPHTLHVWQAFEELPEALEALAAIGEFIERVAPSNTSDEKIHSAG